MSFQQRFFAFFFKRKISEGNEANVLLHCDLKFFAAVFLKQFFLMPGLLTLFQSITCSSKNHIFIILRRMQVLVTSQKLCISFT